VGDLEEGLKPVPKLDRVLIVSLPGSVNLFSEIQDGFVNHPSKRLGDDLIKCFTLLVALPEEVLALLVQVFLELGEPILCCQLR